MISEHLVYALSENTQHLTEHNPAQSIDLYSLLIVGRCRSNVLLGAGCVLWNLQDMREPGQGKLTTLRTLPLPVQLQCWAVQMSGLLPVCYKQTCTDSRPGVVLDSDSSTSACRQTGNTQT